MPDRIATYRPPGSEAARKGYETGRVRLLDKRFYASAAWLRLRASKLSADPLCEECKRAGHYTPAAHVHHVRPRKTHPEGSLDFANLESLCQPCHGAKGVR